MTLCPKCEQGIIERAVINSRVVNRCPSCEWEEKVPSRPQRESETYTAQEQTTPPP